MAEIQQRSREAVDDLALRSVFHLGKALCNARTAVCRGVCCKPRKIFGGIAPPRDARPSELGKLVWALRLGAEHFGR